MASYTYTSSKVQNGATFFEKWWEKNEMWFTLEYDVDTYSDNSQKVTLKKATLYYNGWVVDPNAKPEFCTTCCGLWGLYWHADCGGGAAMTWNFNGSGVPLGSKSFSKTLNKVYNLPPGSGFSFGVLRFGTDTGCGWATRAFNYTNTLSKPSPTPPSLSPSCYANTSNGNTIVFNGGGSWGYCDTGYSSSSYAIYDSASMTTPIRSGSGYSATVSGLSPNTRYWASFYKSNGCYSRSATCSAVTVTPNSLSDATPTTWDKATVRLSVTNGGGEYAPNTAIYLKKCNSYSWSKVADSTTTAVEVINLENLDPETCYQVQARTTTPAGTYTGNTVTFNTPKKGLCIANYTDIQPTINEKTYQVCANFCYEWQTTKTPATIRLYYRVKDGYDDRWYWVDAPDATTNTGENCVEICDLYPNQTVYETYIHTETGEANYDSDMWEFITPVIPEPDIHNCENFDYLTALVCQAIVSLYDGIKDIYANDCSKELCDPYSENPTYLTLFSRILRHFHAMYCLLCDMGNARFMASKPGQYLVGEAGWQDMITKIIEDSPDNWKLATSDAIKRYLDDKLHTVWHYHGSVDYLVETLEELDEFENAESAIVASENKVYRKVDGAWVASTADEDKIDDMGVWHIVNESSTEVGYVQAGSAWYYWENDWQPLDADVVRFAKIINAMWAKKDQAAYNEVGADRLHIDTKDRNEWSCSYPAGERWVTMITEPLEIAPPGYHLIKFKTGENATIIQNQEVLDGALAQKPTDPEKTCMDFVKWVDDDTKADFDWSLPIKKDWDLEAIWSPHPVEITFDIGDGAEGTTPAPINGFCGDKIGTLPTTGFTKEGGTFLHWAIDGVPIDANYELIRDAVAEAVWQMEEHDVTFILGNGQANVVQTVEYGDYALAPNDPTRTDYIFTGWFTDSAFTTAWDATQPIKADLTIWAGWIPAAYTVSFNSNGGSPVPSQTVAYEGYATRPADPTRTGYIIKEWQLDGVTYMFDIPVTENITLDAVWQKVWTVTFDTDGGSPVPETQMIIDGELANSPVEVTKEGYEFAGWYDTAGTEPGCPQPETVTVTFAWGEGGIAYGGDTHDPGTLPAAQTVAVGSKITNPGAPICDTGGAECRACFYPPATALVDGLPHAWLGWAKEDGTLWDFNTMTVAENITLYSKYNSASAPGFCMPD